MGLVSVALGGVVVESSSISLLRLIVALVQLISNVVVKDLLHDIKINLNIVFNTIEPTTL